MLFLIDENVPSSVANVLRSLGHGVELVKDRLTAGTSDEVVAAAADDLDAIVVTVDKDFKRHIARQPPNNQLRWRRLGRVSLSCKPLRMASRMGTAMHLVASEHGYLQGQTDKRVIVEIGGDVIRIER